MPGTWATPRAKGGRPKVRIRPNSSEFPAPGGSGAAAPLPGCEIPSTDQGKLPGQDPDGPNEQDASAEQAPSAGAVAARHRTEEPGE